MAPLPYWPREYDRIFEINGTKRVFRMHNTSDISTEYCELMGSIKFISKITEVEYELNQTNKDSPELLRIRGRTLCLYYDELDDPTILYPLRDVNGIPENLHFYQPEKTDKFINVDGQEWLLRQDYKKWDWDENTNNPQYINYYLSYCKMYEFIGMKFFVENSSVIIDTRKGNYSQNIFDNYYRLCFNEIKKEIQKLNET